jgi:ElaA protein
MADRPLRLRAAPFAELDAATLYGLIRLRIDVFVVEQCCPYPELDGRDTEPATTHLWLEPDQATGPDQAPGPVPVPGAYLRILQEPDGAARIGRVCTATPLRGQGLAARLVGEALQRLGGRPCVLAAQAHLTGFYGRLGFGVTGPEFIEDGIVHVPMRLAPS